MRELTNYEKRIVQADLMPVKMLLKENGLFSEKVKNKYKLINFNIENRYELGGYGRIRNNIYTGKKEISILDEVINNDRLRTATCYHELGHALMGMDTYKKIDLDKKVFEHIVEIKRRYRYELIEQTLTYLSGMQCLEEYLVEKFAQEMQFLCKGIDRSKKKKCICPKISADYNYYSTTAAKYGIFETICDELVFKLFSDIEAAIYSGLKEEFFEEFFYKFDGKEIMLILGNLGKVFQAIMNYANNSRPYYGHYSANSIKRILLDTEHLVKNIQLQNEVVTKRLRI